jgi:hypothetical protein
MERDDLNQDKAVNCGCSYFNVVWPWYPSSVAVTAGGCGFAFVLVATPTRLGQRVMVVLSVPEKLSIVRRPLSL